jgi:hypothetical protein
MSGCSIKMTEGEEQLKGKPKATAEMRGDGVWSTEVAMRTEAG